MQVGRCQQRMHRYLAIAGAVILYAGPARSPAAAQESQGPYKPGLVKGNLTLKPATFKASDGTRVDGEIGRLVVPESRTSDSPNLIELAFVRLKSPSANPQAPLVYLEGGPGGSSTWMAERPRSNRRSEPQSRGLTSVHKRCTSIREWPARSGSLGHA